MNNCFIQYNAPLEKYDNETQKIKLLCQKRMVFYRFRVNFIIFEVYIVSVTAYDKTQLVCIIFEIYTYFFSTIIFCPV